jgi:hypothetical protein
VLFGSGDALRKTQGHGQCPKPCREEVVFSHFSPVDAISHKLSQVGKAPKSPTVIGHNRV